MTYFIDTNTILTDNALSKMQRNQLRDSDIRDAFYKPDRVENAPIPGCKSYIKTWNQNEVGVIAKQKSDGVWLIISVWYRNLFIK